MSDLSEGGRSRRLLLLRPHDRLAQALHGQAGEGQRGDDVQEVQDRGAPGTGKGGGEPAGEQEEKERGGGDGCGGSG